MRKGLLLVGTAMMMGLGTAYLAAQSVAINTDGSDANANAILDIVSPTTGSGKGLLAPRITSAQRTTASAALAGGLLNDSGDLRGGAAQGLLVYQTDGTQGFYYNTSSTATPAWSFLGGGGGSGTVTSITASSPLTGGTISSSGTIGIPKADASTDGYLDDADFSNFDTARQATGAATNENTASTLVKRDGSGDFSAGTVTADLVGNVTGDVTGNLTGNADTATSLSGTLPVSKGGTGATTEAGARTNLGIKSLATQESDAVAITGGTLDGTVIGGTTAAAGTFTDAKVGNANAYSIGDTKVLHKGKDALTGTLVVGDGGSNLTASGGGDNGMFNTFVGLEAGAASETAYKNTAVGYKAMQGNTEGGNNSALGIGAMEKNTEGNVNSAFGSGAMNENTTGNSNSAFGGEALNKNTTGNFNTAVGVSALYLNTTGIGNVAVGVEAGAVNTTGSYNTLIGRNALPGGSDHENSTVIGSQTTGNGSNTMTFGNAAVTDNYFQGSIRLGGTKLLHRGASALEGNLVVGDGGTNITDGGGSSGKYNTFLGLGAGHECGLGANNVAVGYYAIYDSEDGTDNVAIGSGTGATLRNGSGNILIGKSADVAGADDSNSTVIGNGATGNGSNTITIGSASSLSGTYIYGIHDYDNAGGTAVKVDTDGRLHRDSSSVRYKDDINYDGVDGNLAHALKPVSYKCKTGNGEEYIGFIAEDVAEVEPRLVRYDREGRPDSVDYSHVTALLAKAVQDLKAENDLLKARLEAIEQALAE